MELLNHYSDFLNSISKSDSLQSVRQKGATAVETLNWPHRKMEDWRYTSVKDLKDESFTVSSLAKTGLSHDSYKLVANSLSEKFYNIVFINGAFDKTLSNLTLGQEEIKGLSINSISQISSEEFIDVFEAQNAAFAGEGICLTVEKETSIRKPIMLTFFTSIETGPSLMVTPRVQINVGSGSALSVVENHWGLSGQRYFVNAVVETKVEKNATLKHVHFQNQGTHGYHISGQQHRLNEHSQLTTLLVNLGSAWCRNNVNLPLEKENSTAHAYGVSVLNQKQHLDQNTLINHKVGHCVTDQVYKNILAEESKAIFNGKVFIQPNAQKAFSEQLNNNLLVSTKAEANSKPQLEIFADDVKATHGSTVGQLNKEELFYFQSRGISIKEALPLLGLGFASDVVYKIEEDSIIEWIVDQIKNKFSAMSDQLKV